MSESRLLDQEVSQEPDKHKSTALPADPIDSSILLLFCFLLVCIYLSISSFPFHLLFFSLHSLLPCLFLSLLCVVFFLGFLDALFLSSFHLLFLFVGLFVCLFCSFPRLFTLLQLPFSPFHLFLSLFYLFSPSSLSALFGYVVLIAGFFYSKFLVIHFYISLFLSFFFSFYLSFCMLFFSVLNSNAWKTKILLNI